jgi:hypothetical protein
MRCICYTKYNKTRVLENNVINKFYVYIQLNIWIIDKNCSHIMITGNRLYNVQWPYSVIHHIYYIGYYYYQFKHIDIIIWLIYNSKKTNTEDIILILQVCIRPPLNPHSNLYTSHALSFLSSLCAYHSISYMIYTDIFKYFECNIW